MNQPKISVIIPVYNVALYVEKCIRSLMEQTLDDIEFLIIDDCSPDESVEIIKKVVSEYPKRKNQVRLISHKTNMGLGRSRETGLKVARGTYVISCDSDDWIDPELYERLYNRAVESGADIVGCDYMLEFENMSRPSIQKFDTCPQTCIHLSLRSKLHCGLCNKLVRRSLYVDNFISSIPGVNMWEDVGVIIRLYHYAKKIAKVDLAGYHYRQTNMNSYCATKSWDSLLEMNVVVDFLENFFKSQGVEERYRLSLLQLKLSVKLNCILFSPKSRRKEWLNLYPEANSEIFNFKAIALPWRLLLWCASKSALNCVNLIAKIGKH